MEEATRKKRLQGRAGMKLVTNTAPRRATPIRRLLRHSKGRYRILCPARGRVPENLDHGEEKRERRTPLTRKTAFLKDRFLSRRPSINDEKSLFLERLSSRTDGQEQFRLQRCPTHQCSIDIGWLSKSMALSAFTLPPYWITVLSAVCLPKISLNCDRISAWTSSA